MSTDAERAERERLAAITAAVDALVAATVPLDAEQARVARALIRNGTGNRPRSAGAA